MGACGSCRYQLPLTQANFPIGLSGIFLITDDVNLDISLVEQAVVCPVAAIHKCVQKSSDSHPIVECQVS